MLRGEIRLVDLDNVYPFQVGLPAEETALRVDSEAQAEQIRSVSIERLGPPLGLVPTHLMTQLDDALRLHLHL
jgi:mRNA interferase MazF